MKTQDPHAADRAHVQFERLVFFSDAVFAIAITLLVLDLRLPEASHGVVDLSQIAGKLFGFFLSFTVIGLYWLDHHQLFGGLRREDGALRLANLVFLASVVFLPFPTSVIAEYPATVSSVIFYALSVAAVGAALTVLVVVARRPALLAQDERDVGPAGAMVYPLGAPLVFLVSAVVALRDPHLAMRLWWLTAPAVWLTNWIGRRLSKRPAAG
ncbi:TMEM175 family protein [Phenylobacterium montanum]|uniref:DUF1211 domain-containing protein n=1 Tax=Phenylobacterium montanum TaxID=2823693 RepID=A0A975IVI6_9CAUL|nr:TMEM175 family protein [Caulobacter sp. S6]QUD87361.1 DUF1211 domain-containing protein [Caulobacter sp. S6]